MQYWVYILASARNGTLYVGMTNDLVRRIYEHKNEFLEGFTQQHAVKMLVYYEATESPDAAIMREKQLKKWNRIWKLRLIEDFNPHWNDLYPSIC